MLESELWKNSVSQQKETDSQEFGNINLPAHVQSNTDHMSLVLLCEEKDLKQFGYAKLFSEMLEVLKDLENGISVGNKTIKGALYGIADDNLGSHGNGGLTQNFGCSKYFGRYGKITQIEF